MKKTWLGVVLGAVVYFVWGMLSWTVLPWHTNTMKALPEEQLISDTLKTVVLEPGYYPFPNMTSHNGGKLDAKAWAEKCAKGPTGAVIFNPNGSVMDAKKFVVAIVGALGIALVSMLMLVLTRDRVKTMLQRALLVSCGGLVVGLSVHLSYWNWMGFPADFTAVAFFDSLFSFFLVGLAEAVFVPEV